MRDLISLIAVFCLASLAFAAERKEVRVLYDFEDAAELEGLRAGTENVTFDLVQDNGVTRGQNCCRMVFQKGADYGCFFLGKDKIKNWGDFDYIAFDIFMEREGKQRFCFELFDAASKNYPTRCTFEELFVRQGKQTMLVQINRAKRNGKEGREWHELQPQDKIAMDALTRVKMFLQPPKEADLVMWVDNIRLMQEDAVGQKMTVALPPGAQAFDFGAAGTLVPGFTSVSTDKPADQEKGFALSGKKLANCGKHWPDPLTGDGVTVEDGSPFQFQLSLPDGDYLVWLSAGMRIDPQAPNKRFLLKLGDETLYDDTPEDLASEKYLFRFLKTQYSERENALYLDFIDRMYPAYEKKIKVAGGKLTIEAANHWLAALIVLPADKEAEFKKLTGEIRSERLRMFNCVTQLDPQKKPQKQPGDGPFVFFIPDPTRSFHPAVAPSDTERKRAAFDLAAAPGQRIIFRAAVTPFANLGKCKLEMSGIKGPAEIPASAARVYFQDYRVRGSEVGESALVPSSEINVEQAITSCWWLWLKVPEDAPAGEYSGSVNLKTGDGKTATLPLKLKVYPFKLEEILPFSFGMYYGPRGDNKVVSEQLRFMRELGMTATGVGGGSVQGIRDDNTVNVTFDTRMYDLAREAGMGRHPMQMMMGNALGGARTIARRGLGFGAKVDQQVGCEMDHPRMKPLFVDFARKFAAFIKQQNMPVAVEIVDEPREVPNPWNRNLLHTNMYGDWLKEGGIPYTFVTPMGDTQSGKDYTSLVDHSDIVSTHAGKGSERLMKLTPEKKKILWLYNTGMDRLSWGFYNWRVGSVGRWEWHFCFGGGDETNTGYPNKHEWYNSFTNNDAFAPHAPASYSGAMLFKSVYLTCADGIADSAYLVTLEKAMAAAEGNAAKAEALGKAKAFLAELKEKIPFLPGVKGIAGADDGALVGKGLAGPAQEQCETWRRQVAELIIALK